MLQPTNVDDFSHVIKSRLAALSKRASQLLSPRPGRTVLLAPGEMAAWDDCCDGQVWARLVNITPLPSNTPARRPGLHPCAVPELMATFELGVVRCAHSLNDRGEAPSAVQVTEDGEQSIDDMSNLFGAMRCMDWIRSSIVWTPQGPDGGCHGGYWQGTMLVSNCVGCKEEEPDG